MGLPRKGRGTATGHARTMYGYYVGVALCRVGLHRRMELGITVGRGIDGYSIDEDCHRPTCSWERTRTVDH
jgi:hypothetical protein